MFEPSETIFPGGVVTMRVKPNGEHCTYFKVGELAVTTYTESPLWKWGKDIPWKTGHEHRGVFQSCVVLHGWVFYADEQRDESGEYFYSGRVLTPTLDSHVLVAPGVPHKFLLGSRSVLQTTTWGNALGNPDENGKDWWPARSLDEWCGKRSVADVQRVVLSVQ